MDEKSKISEVIGILEEIKEDSSVPKNIKLKIDDIVIALNSDLDLPIRINKALNILDEISDEMNLEAYTRTLVWNVVTILEGLNS